MHDTLRRAAREQGGRDPDPSAGIVDSQPVCTAQREECRGYDAGKRVSGRKRHILVDVEGLLIACYVTPASTSDHEGCKHLLAGLKPLVPRLSVIWGDSAYAGKKLADWCHDEGGWKLEVVRRKPVPRFEPVPRRWVVERTFAWLSRNRGWPATTSVRCRLQRPFWRLPWFV